MPSNSRTTGRKGRRRGRRVQQVHGVPVRSPHPTTTGADHPKSWVLCHDDRRLLASITRMRRPTRTTIRKMTALQVRGGPARSPRLLTTRDVRRSRLPSNARGSRTRRMRCVVPARSPHHLMTHTAHVAGPKSTTPHSAQSPSQDARTRRTSVLQVRGVPVRSHRHLTICTYDSCPNMYIDSHHATGSRRATMHSTESLLA
jgi:hypothetical protein